MFSPSWEQRAVSEIAQLGTLCRRSWASLVSGCYETGSWQRVNVLAQGRVLLQHERLDLSLCVADYNQHSPIFQMKMNYTQREKHQVAIQIYKNNSATHTMRPGTNILIIKHIWSCRCGSEAICPLALGLDILDIDLVFSPISFWDPLPPVFVWLPVLVVSAHFLYVSYWSRQSRQWSLVFVFHQSAFRLPSCLSTCVLLSD